MVIYACYEVKMMQLLFNFNLCMLITINTFEVIRINISIKNAKPRHKMFEILN